MTCVHWWLQLTRLLFQWIHNGFVLVCLFVCFKCQFKNNWLHILFFILFDGLFDYVICLRSLLFILHTLIGFSTLFILEYDSNEQVNLSFSLNDNDILFCCFFFHYIFRQIHLCCSNFSMFLIPSIRQINFNSHTFLVSSNAVTLRINWNKCVFFFYKNYLKLNIWYMKLII